jgi:hypothetical protein
MKLLYKNLVFIILISNAVVFSFYDNSIRLDYILFILLFLLLLFNKDFYIPKKVILILSFSFLIGISTALIYSSNLNGVIINFIALAFLISLIYSLFKVLGNKIILEIYCRAARFCVFFAFIQFFAFFITDIISFLDLTYLYDFRWLLGSSEPSYTSLYLKLSSVFTEPSYFAPFVLPYLIICFYNYSDKKTNKNLFHFISILFVFLFSFSLIGNVSLIIFIIINQSLRDFFSLKKIIFFSLFFLAVFLIPEMYVRLTDFSFENIDDVNLSTLSYIINIDYFINLINWQLFFGYGLDSYQILMNYAVENNLSFIDYTLLHEKFSYSFENGSISSIEHFQLNASPLLFLRLPFEFGIFTFIYLVFKFKKKYISNIFFVGVLAFSLRSGQYLRFDMMLFIFMFIYSLDFLDLKKRKITI